MSLGLAGVDGYWTGDEVWGYALQGAPDIALRG